MSEKRKGKPDIISLSPQNRAFLQTRQCLTETGATEGIIDILSPLLAGDHSIILQDIQMAGNRGHVPTGILLKFTDAAFPVQKHLNNHQAYRMPQGLEYAGKGLQLPDGRNRIWRRRARAIGHKR